MLNLVVVRDGALGGLRDDRRGWTVRRHVERDLVVSFLGDILGVEI